MAVVPWFTPLHAPATWWIARRAKRAVVIVHNPLPHEYFPLARWLTRKALAKYEKCVVHGEANKHTLTTLLPEMTIVSLGHPPSLQVRVTDLPKRPPIKALFLGYVRDYKGLDIGILSLSVLRRRGADVHLTVAGHSWIKRETLEGIARTAEVSDLVDFRLEYVADGEIQNLLQDHHFLLAPYRSATSSGVIPLALAAGRPVASTLVGAIGEIVIEGRNGALAEPGDAESLADAIERVVADLESLARAASHSTPEWTDLAQVIASE